MHQNLGTLLLKHADDVLHSVLSESIWWKCFCKSYVRSITKKIKSDYYCDRYAIYFTVFYGTEKAYKTKYLLLNLSDHKLKQSGNNVKISSCHYHVYNKENKVQLLL